MKDPKKLLVPLILCFLLLAVWAAQGVSQKNPYTVKIKIKIVNGEIQCVPDPAYARLGEEVIWKCKYDFKVKFVRSPLKKSELDADEVEPENEEKYKTKGREGKVINEEAALKQEKVTFKYSVIVYYSEDTTLIADPDLEIIP